MSEQSAFNRQNIEESTVPSSPGLLEQFNLPPEVIAFIRKNQRTIWIITGCIAFVVVAVALLNQYHDYREDKAATALAVALEKEGSEKADALAKVVADFGSTPSGMWGRVELAHIVAEDGDIAKAIAEFEGIKTDISSTDPLMPLVVYALGILYEKNNELDKAIDMYNALKGYKGFELSSYEAMGRLYESQGQQAKALDMYRKSIEPGPEGAAAASRGNPDQDTIQAKINALQN